MNIQTLINESEIYGFKYPKQFLKIVELKLLNFDVWYIMDNEMALYRLKGLKERYPTRNLIPFAKRVDNDDIACFEIGKGETVQIVHDFSSLGYEQRKEYINVWEWLKEVIDDMIDYNDDI